MRFARSLPPNRRGIRVGRFHQPWVRPLRLPWSAGRCGPEALSCCTNPAQHRTHHPLCHITVRATFSTSHNHASHAPNYCDRWSPRRSLRLERTSCSISINARTSIHYVSNSVGINASWAMTGSLVGNVGAKHLSWATMPTETNSFEKFQKYLFHIRLLHPVIPCTMLTVSTDF